MIQKLKPNQHQKVMARIEAIPAYQALNLKIEELSEGTCIATSPRDPAYDGIFQCFHGGMLMAVADTIACFALLTCIDPEEAMATTDMNIRFLAPCFTEVKATATIIKLGKTLTPVEVKLTDTNDKLVALCQVTYIRLGQKALKR
jgi:uncharacterized protein (TIGR00369 family)